LAASALPADLAEIIGGASLESARPRSLGWLNTTVLELFRHIDPLRPPLDRHGQPVGLGVLMFNHFRAKYGLGKMALAYTVDFIGNLRLHAANSLRCVMFIHWAHLAAFVGARQPAACFAHEPLQFYLFAVQLLVRTNTHRQQKELDTGDVVVTRPRVDAIIDGLLRNVALSCDSQEAYVALRAQWVAALLSTEQLPAEWLGIIQRHQWRSPETAKTEVATLSGRYQRDEELPVMADVLLFLLVWNYGHLRQLLLLHAEALHAAAEATMDADDVPAPTLLMARLATWPLRLVAHTGDAAIDDLDDGDDDYDEHGEGDE
jgi:hypothetical protein